MANETLKAGFDKYRTAERGQNAQVFAQRA